MEAKDKFTHNKLVLPLFARKLSHLFDIHVDNLYVISTKDK